MISLRRFFLLWSIFPIGFSVVAVVLAAQTPAKPAEQVIPAPDELDLAYFDAVKFAQKRANDACQGLDAVKEYSTLVASVQTKVEKRHPGLTVNWNTFVLMAKK